MSKIIPLNLLFCFITLLNSCVTESNNQNSKVSETEVHLLILNPLTKEDIEADKKAIKSLSYFKSIDEKCETFFYLKKLSLIRLNAFEYNFQRVLNNDDLITKTSREAANNTEQPSAIMNDINSIIEDEIFPDSLYKVIESKMSDSILFNDYYQKHNDENNLTLIFKKNSSDTVIKVYGLTFKSFSNVDSLNFYINKSLCLNSKLVVNIIYNPNAGGHKKKVTDAISSKESSNSPAQSSAAQNTNKENERDPKKTDTIKKNKKKMSGSAHFDADDGSYIFTIDENLPYTNDDIFGQVEISLDNSFSNIFQRFEIKKSSDKKALIFPKSLSDAKKMKKFPAPLYIRFVVDTLDEDGSYSGNFKYYPYENPVEVLCFADGDCHLTNYESK